MENILRAYSRLTALKNNLPNDRDIEERYIKEYEDIVIVLENETKTNLSEFKISESDLQFRIISHRPSIPSIGQRGGTNYSKTRFCQRAMLMSKLDALLSYFQIKYLTQDKSEIGFGIK